MKDNFNQTADVPDEKTLGIRNSEAWQNCFKKMSTEMGANTSEMRLWLLLEKIKEMKDQDPVKSKLEESPEMMRFIEKCAKTDVATAISDHYAKIADNLEMSFDDFFSNMEKAYSCILSDNDAYKEIRNLRLEIEINRLEIEELTRFLEKCSQAEGATDAVSLLRKEIKDCKNKLSNANKVIDRLTIDLDTTEKEKTWLDQQIEQLATQIEEQRMQIDGLRSQLQETKENAERYKANADQERDNNQRLNSQLEKAEKRIIETGGKNESLESKFSLATTTISELKEDLVIKDAEINNLNQQINKLKIQLSELTRDKKGIQDQASDPNRVIEILKEETEEQMRKIAELESLLLDRQKDIDLANHRICMLNERLENVNKSAESMDLEPPPINLSSEEIIAQMPLLTEITTLDMNEELIIENGNQPLLIALKGDKISLKKKSAVTIDYAYDGVEIDLYGDLSFAVVNNTSPECKNNPVQITIHNSNKTVTQVILGQNVSEECVNIRYNKS